VRRVAQSWEPRKPPPPVIRIRMGVE